jgi:hypothetical protein
MLTESSTNGEIDVLTFYNAIEAIYARCRAGRQDRDGGGGKKEGRAIVGLTMTERSRRSRTPQYACCIRLGLQRA